ncbi:MAG: hypothetical protein O7D96_10930 [SAR324 cluster bacterium]|nr:hypothetical protein [SAR324 cluster bacterium]
MSRGGLEPIRWHRRKAGSTEHSHDARINEPAAEALYSQMFGASAASVRLHAIVYNLLSALKRLALPAECGLAFPPLP